MRRIGNYAFGYCRSMNSVMISNSITSIGDHAFWSCSNLIDVTVEWATPLSVPSDIFSDVNTSVATLHVPTGTKAAYKADPVWGTFGTIDDGTTTLDLTLSQEMTFKTSANATTDVLISGQTYTFTTTVKNTSTTETYKGNFYLKTTTDYGVNELYWEKNKEPYCTLTPGQEIVLTALYTPGDDDVDANKQYTLWFNKDGDVRGSQVKSGSYSNPVLISVLKTAIVSVTGVSISAPKTVFNKGETAQFTATVSPTNAANQNVTWSSSNTTVATVSPTNNKTTTITAQNEGTATITVVTQDGGYSKSVDITVNKTSPPPSETPDIRMESIISVKQDVTVGEYISFGVKVKNYNSNKWMIAFYLKDAEVSSSNIWGGFGYDIEISAAGDVINKGNLTINSPTNFRVPADAQTGDRTWKLYYAIKDAGSDEVKSQGSFVNGVAVHVNPAPADQKPYVELLSLNGYGTESNPITFAGTANASRTFSVNSNVEWIADCNSTLFTVKPINNSSFTVTTKSENKGAAIPAKISVRSKDVAYQLATNNVINIRQEALAAEKNYLRATVDPTTLPVSGGTLKVTIESDMDWTITSDAAWLKVPTEYKQGSGNTTFSITILQSPDASKDNPGNLKFSAGSAVLQTIPVRQNASIGTLQGIIRDKNSNIPIEGTTLVLSSPNGQMVSTTGGNFSVQLPYGTTGTIAVSRIGYDKFESKLIDGSYSSTTSYNISEKTPSVNLTIVGTQSLTNPVAPQENVLRLDAAIDNKRSITKLQPTTIDVQIYNNSTTDWTGKLLFVENEPSSLPIAYAAKEYAYSDQVTIPAQKSKSVSFNFLNGFSGKYTQFTVKSMKLGDTQWKWVDNNKYENPVTFTNFVDPPSENEQKEKEAAGNFLKTLCWLNYTAKFIDDPNIDILFKVNDEFIHDPNVKNLQQVYEKYGKVEQYVNEWNNYASGIIAQIENKDLNGIINIHDHTGDGIGGCITYDFIQQRNSYMQQFNKIPSLANEMKDYYNLFNEITNPSSVAAFFDIAKKINNKIPTPGQAIFNTYLDIGKKCADHIDKFKQVLGNRVIATTLADEGQTKFQLKILNKSGNDISSNVIISNISTVKLFWSCVATEDDARMDVNSLNIETPCTLTNESGIVNVKFNFGSPTPCRSSNTPFPGAFHGALQVKWTNGKIDWVPFNTEFVEVFDIGNNVRDRYNIGAIIKFQTSSSSDSNDPNNMIANMINLIVNF